MFQMGIAYVNAALRNAGFEVDGLNMNHVDAEDRYAYLADYIVEKKIDCVLSAGLARSGGSSRRYLIPQNWFVQGLLRFAAA